MIRVTFLEINKDLRPPPAAALWFVRTSYEASEELSSEKLQTSINV